MNEEAIRAKAREIVQHELDHYYVSPRPETQIDTRFDLREAIAAALHEAVESGLATAQAELAKVKTENEVLTKNLARSGRCYAENMDTLGKVQAELATRDTVLDYIRANCKVIAWPSKGAYPIEHNPAASKDSWGDIVHLASLTPTPPAKEQP